MKKFNPSSIWRWLDEYLLFFLSLLLIVCIPLLPKIPLFDVLPGYIVRARTEDIIIGLTGIVWLVQYARRKITINTQYGWLIIFYSISGITSILLGVILTQTIPFELLHIGKSSLTFFRYLEYFSVIFFITSSIDSRRKLNIAYTLLLLSLVGVLLYGFGQKFSNFPLYSTMNREYSKGVRLTLEPGGKVQSTFAGHYDLAAYLVLLLPIVAALTFFPISKNLLATKQIFWMGGLTIIHLMGIYVLILTGSKIALASYVLGVFAVCLQLWCNLSSKKIKLYWAVAAAAISVIGAILFWTIAPVSTKTNISSLVEKVVLKNSSSAAKPVDVDGDGYEIKKVASQSATGETLLIEERVKSDWSPNAQKYGLSTAIRLDTLWPRALSGWANNPFFGSGYGTLGMLDTNRFVEADSTDNNYLRTIGETGILGFIIFYGLIIFTALESYKTAQKSTGQLKFLMIGFVGTSIGILMNAIYIDVFAASKVAFHYWILVGLTLSAQQVFKNQKRSQFHLGTKVLNHLKHNWPIYTVALIAFFLFHIRPYAQNSVIKNFDENTLAIEQITRAACQVKFGQIGLCNNNGYIDYSTSFYSFLLSFFMHLKNNPTTFYFLNMSLFIIGLISLYQRLCNTTINKYAQFFWLSLFVFIANMFEVQYYPLSDSLLIFLIFTVVAITILSDIFKSQTYRRSYIYVFIFILFSLSTAFFSSSISDITIRFRNSADTYAYESIRYTDEFFSNKGIAQPRLITVMNPLYAQMYQLQNFSLLPLNETQLEAPKNKEVWSQAISSPLTQMYSNILSENQKLFMSDFGTQTDQESLHSIQEIKNNFDINYVALGCKETCNIYNITEQSDPQIVDPVTLTTHSLSTHTLKRPYTFSILSNRFDPKFPTVTKRYLTKYFTDRLANLDLRPYSFSILTGDLTRIPDAIQNAYITTFLNSFRQPFIFNSGNSDLIPIKMQPSPTQVFFTDTEYYLIIGGDYLSLSDTQRIEIYNYLLALEKMKNIKNVFVIAHDLDWQTTPNDSELLTILKDRLPRSPQITKHIITANHMHIQNPQLSRIESSVTSYFDKETNTSYWVSLIAGTKNDIYLEFTVSQDDSVTIVEKKFF